MTELEVKTFILLDYPSYIRDVCIMCHKLISARKYNFFSRCLVYFSFKDCFFSFLQNKKWTSVKAY